MNIHDNYQTPSAFAFYKKLLIAALFYFLLMVVRFVYFEVDPYAQWVYLALLILTGVCMGLLRSFRFLGYSVFVFSGGLIISFVLMWIHTGGIYGSLSTTYYTLLVGFVAVLPRNYKIPSALVICTICLTLSLYSNTPIDANSAAWRWIEIDYLINSVIIAICVVYVKRDLESERQSYLSYNDQIDQLNEELFQKRKKLLEQRHEIQSTKNNLEDIILRKTVELQKKNKQLSDYAYNNAHILRAPLSNILGLIQILEKENLTKPDHLQELKGLKERADHLDQLVKEVNQILR
ncbi:hypothetical protein N6H18_12165 [Reichenbachiella agarivorans]|uniref:histidine kinase n=1 Tax=Reichenbachiella agarivorans TaxID=2979464 RepID=A0ABY6CLZ7_9BACT|nr:hypothetical protein [Reichenbachiella agarivorans]UXP31105.1 hypothetical protein N6H18_12165 [Reichenbachiella agarivorans]